MAIENDGLAHDGGIGGKMCLPESEVQQGYRRACHMLFFRGEASAQCGRQTVHEKKICRYEPALHIFSVHPRVSAGKWAQDEPEPARLRIHGPKRGGMILI